MIERGLRRKVYFLMIIIINDIIRFYEKSWSFDVNIRLYNLIDKYCYFGIIRKFSKKIYNDMGLISCRLHFHSLCIFLLPLPHLLFFKGTPKFIF